MIHGPNYVLRYTYRACHICIIVEGLDAHASWQGLKVRCRHSLNAIPGTYCVVLIFFVWYDKKYVRRQTLTSALLLSSLGTT